MMRGIDLHTHTTASDGIYTPKELIELAVSKNIVALAITDHDTVDGLKEGVDYARMINYNLISGIEFSIDYSGGSFHLLGLYIDHKNPELLHTIDRLQRLREWRANRIVEILRDHGIMIAFDEVRNEAMGGTIGKPHIARVMVRMGYCKDIREVFRNYMNRGQPGYVKRERISLEEAISVIGKSGGITIIAHPISLNFGSFIEFECRMERYKGLGIEGIEVYSSMHNMEEVREFHRIARKYDLLISGGSDFHGDKDEEMGY